MGLLFQKRFHEGLVGGAVTLTFRRWDRPQVKPGGRYRCHPIGVLEVDAVERVEVRAITDAEARASGFADRAELTAYLETVGGPLAKDETLFRVKLHWVGDVDAKPVAFEAELTTEDVLEISKRLDKLGVWTRPTLALIRKHPRRRAGDLADLLGREKLEFKEDVRKLKRLGLTISHEVGYSLSPRGEAYLKASAAPSPRKRRPR